MTTEQYINITAGPSREELVDAWKYAHSGIAEVAEVRFTGMVVVKTGDVRRNGREGEFTARINGLEHEDGSGFSFNLTVYATPKPVRGKQVKMYYSAKSRHGYLSLNQ